MTTVCLDNESSELKDTLIQSVNRRYTIKNATSRAQAEAYLLTDPLCPQVDGTYPILRRENVRVNELKHPKFWSAEVAWKRWIPKEIDQEKVTAQITVESAKVTTAKEHIGSYTADTTEIDHSGFINAGKDGRVDGVDIPFPVLSFTIRKTLAKGTATLAFAAAHMPYAGKANSVGWRGFGKGEVRFDGISTNDEDPDFDEASYSFAASPTVTNLVQATPWGDITVPEKLGWDYLWFSRAKYEFGTWMVEAPHTAHVDRVLDFANLNDIL